MAAERPTATARSLLGSICAIAAGCLCLASTFAACLNPLTDDQPSARDQSPVVDDLATPGPNTPGSEPPDGELVGGEGSSSSAGGSASDAGVDAPDDSRDDLRHTAQHVDAGPDSGSLEPPP